MQVTGYSCLHLKKKNKHGCKSAICFYCNVKRYLVNPICCKKNCNTFERIRSSYQQNLQKDDEIIIL